MKQFDYSKYLKNNPLLKEVDESWNPIKKDIKIGEKFMSGMNYIPKLTPEIKDKISQLEKQYPSHTFSITSNSKWKPDRPDLAGTYTLSYNGPYDEQLRDMIDKINESKVV